MQNRKKQIAAKVCSVIGTLLLLVAILICIPLTLPRLAGYQIYHVISGSMEPAIPVESVVYVKDVAPADIQKKDVIAFHSVLGEEAIITHRVVSNNRVAGEIVTKGDANAKEDLEPVPYENVLGKVALTVPVLGKILATIATIQGKATVGSVILLALLLHIAAGRLRK